MPSLDMNDGALEQFFLLGMRLFMVFQSFFVSATLQAFVKLLFVSTRSMIEDDVCVLP